MHNKSLKIVLVAGIAGILGAVLSTGFPGATGESAPAGEISAPAADPAGDIGYVRVSLPGIMAPDVVAAAAGQPILLLVTAEIPGESPEPMEWIREPSSAITCAQMLRMEHVVPGGNAIRVACLDPRTMAGIPGLDRETLWGLPPEDPRPVIPRTIRQEPSGREG